MLMRWRARPASSSVRISTTRPSAGETSTPGPDGTVRSGSRKKFKTNNARIKKKAAARKKNLSGQKNPKPSSPPPIKISGRPYQYPSFTIIVECAAPPLKSILQREPSPHRNWINNPSSLAYASPARAGCCPLVRSPGYAAGLPLFKTAIIWSFSRSLSFFNLTSSSFSSSVR